MNFTAEPACMAVAAAHGSVEGSVLISTQAAAFSA